MAEIMGNTTTTPIDPKKFGGSGGNIITKEYVEEIKSGEWFEISPDIATGVYLLRKGAEIAIRTMQSIRFGKFEGLTTTQIGLRAAEDTEILITESYEENGKNKRLVYIGEGIDTNCYGSVWAYSWEWDWIKENITGTMSATFERVDETGDVSVVVDQTYNPESENAQSGKAVAEAITEAKQYADDLLDNIEVDDGSIVGTPIGEKCAEFSALFKDTEKIDSFIFFSDPHTLGAESNYEKQFRQYIQTLKRYYAATPTSFVACGGDWLELHNRTEACFRLGYIDGLTKSSFDRFYNVIGNHDHNSNTSGVSYSEEDDVGVLPVDTVRNLLLRDEENTYYSFDGNNTKFYVLDSGPIWWVMYPQMWEQVEWLGNALKTNDCENSAIFVHATYETTLVPFMQNILDLCKAYNNNETITLNDIEYDFTNCTGKMRFVLSGHKHQDKVEVVNGIPVILTDDMRSGDKETFDLCLIDYDNYILKMVRVGSGENRNVGVYGNSQQVGLIIEEKIESVIFLRKVDYNGSGLKTGTPSRICAVSSTESGVAIPIVKNDGTIPEPCYALKVPPNKSTVTVFCPEDTQFIVKQLTASGAGAVTSDWSDSGTTYTINPTFPNWILQFRLIPGSSYKPFPDDYDTSRLYFEYDYVPPEQSESTE